ncbi:pentapeptide repeat-containing protein [Nocardioides mesophilus]|uniref:Pentapeptide repeat-containing protein n=1 Tax=Nocardioides mesophilus TaxID=433659 RepID=A0A7G9RB68_9ACTN|nr:pentapeptide repeat-containing protein [Nocardioides mesophilus]QNN52843.1 pentapeptide repeat-containing protein [Nocardioides mesophilus]
MAGETTVAREHLRADCSSCVGLCCVALPFTRSADFGFDKAAGEPCRHLGADFGCGIHERLREAGMPGCVAFDCFGAGQRISRGAGSGTGPVPAGAGGRAAPTGALARAPWMSAALPVVRQLHELLWYLTESLSLAGVPSLRARLQEALEDVERLAAAAVGRPADVDVGPVRVHVGALLTAVSQEARGREDAVPASHARADFAGATLAGADLRCADLRGACLIAADLRDADLRRADLLGADLRDADLTGANLTGALFLTRSQVGAARGDARTRLPAGLERPAHWS